MPILLVFVLIAACLPVKWPLPPFAPEPEAALALTVGAVVGVLAVAFALRTWVVRTLARDPVRRYEVARTYNKWRRLLFFVNVGAVAACVLWFGWGWLVQHELLVPWNGVEQLAPRPARGDLQRGAGQVVFGEGEVRRAVWLAPRRTATITAWHS